MDVAFVTSKLISFFIFKWLGVVAEASCYKEIVNADKGHKRKVHQC
ncbi:unnamed protein product [Camellia sinensis]